MAEVTKQRTIASERQVRDALETAWRAEYREALSDDIKALLLAISDLETGTWQSMFNHNLGNIIVVSESTPYYRALDTGNPRKFRAYTSLESGAAGLIRQLRSSTRPQWEAGLLSGDPTFFVESLKGLHGGPAYFEADFNRYLNGFLQRWGKYAPITQPTTNPVEPNDDTLLKVTVVISAGALAAYLVRKLTK